MESTSATYDGTREFAKQYPNLQYYPLGTTDFMVSQVGFGCYRIDPRVHNHQLALRTALIHGVNLIDTSTNYGDGGSEQLVGHLLGLMFAGGQLKREQVVITSKIGYLQGSNYETSQERKAAGTPWPDLVEYSDGLEHCIHPKFLADQLSHSMDRLQVETLDICLLHNPEYYLGWANKNGIDIEEARETYYRRIQQAFIHFESEVAAGRIRYYGISSNSFPVSAESPEFTSLSYLWEIAQTISENHHFRVIQLPLNLLETGGLTTANQPEGLSTIEYAEQLGLGVLINRPLNAVVGSTLIRLADPPELERTNNDDVSKSLHELSVLEDRFRTSIIPMLDGEEDAVINRLKQYVSAGSTLNGRWHTLGTYHQWQQTVTSYLLPRLDAARNFLATPGNLPEEGMTWLNDYVLAVNTAFRAIGGVYAGLARDRVQTLRQQIESAEPKWLSATLSQSAIRALRTTSGVGCVLVGMRHPEYVADVLEELAKPMMQKPNRDAWLSLSNS